MARGFNVLFGGLTVNSNGERSVLCRGLLHGVAAATVEGGVDNPVGAGVGPIGARVTLGATEDLRPHAWLSVDVFPRVAFVSLQKVFGVIVLFESLSPVIERAHGFCGVLTSKLDDRRRPADGANRAALAFTETGRQDKEKGVRNRLRVFCGPVAPILAFMSRGLFGDVSVEPPVEQRGDGAKGHAKLGRPALPTLIIIAAGPALARVSPIFFSTSIITWAEAIADGGIYISRRLISRD